MKTNNKFIFRIVGFICVMAVCFAIPGFAETYDELKEKFVTREEWNEWINGAEGSTGISQVLSSLEHNGQLHIVDKVKYEMSVRSLEPPTPATGG